jgi:hypothetical protein
MASLLESDMMGLICRGCEQSLKGLWSFSESSESVHNVLGLWASMHSQKGGLRGARSLPSEEMQLDVAATGRVHVPASVAFW